ncbi:hypothetical protein F4680DRAFT_449885 [Xylaria scruposa]|nr:hypothetical protein F4680DRAFT_449885 [Xylaria scruposa]
MDTARRLFGHSNPSSSPWANRFPLDDSTIIVGRTRHSLLAPKNPRINDPKYYDQDPDLDKNHRPRNNQEIDSLLWSEKVQRRTFWGARTFQLAALNRRLMFSNKYGLVTVGSAHRQSLSDRIKALINVTPKKPGASPKEEPDHLQIYQRERILVDETKWLRFLRKNRWFDWIQFSPDDGISKPDKTWSVDDARIWNFLGVSLELANRILRALIDEKNDGDYWSNFEDIFGEPPTEDASVILSHSMEQRISEERGTNTIEFEQTVTATVEESEARLEQLLSGLIWAFEDNPKTHAVTRPDPDVGDEESPYSTIITINVDKLEALLNPDLTLGEICQLQVDLTITIVHELMHAVYFARCIKDDYVGNLLDPERTGRIPKDEPYLDAEGFAEAGFYMEQSFFGGVCETIPIPLGKSRPPPPLCQVFREWPSSGYSSSYTPASEDKPFMKDGHLNTVYHTPTTWPSKMLTGSFWDDPEFKKSDDFFHNGRVLVMKVPIENLHTTDCDAPRVTRINNKPGQPENVQVGHDWQYQMKLWRDMRQPWYKKAWVEWGASPWSELHERRNVDLFAKAFAKKDAVACAQIADYMVKAVDWTQDQDKFNEYMPTQGLLMMASIPLRRRRVAKLKPSILDFIIEFAPSQKAAAAGHDRTVYMRPDVLPPQEAAAEVSELYVQSGQKIQNFTQVAYLQSIEDMIQLIMRLRGVVYGEFLDAIKDAKAALLKDRAKLARNYPGNAHTTRWASKWVFKFPEYDPTIRGYDGKQWKKFRVATE